MHLKKHINPGLSISLVLAGVFLFYAISCKDQLNSGSMNSTTAHTDSVKLWIDLAQNMANAPEDRMLYLKKAHASANKWKKDTSLVRQLSRIQWTYMDLEDSLQFRNSNRQTRVLAQALEDSLGLANSYWDLGTFFDRNNMKDSAYFYLSRANKIFISSGHERRAGRTSYEIALLQSKVKDYTGSEKSVINAVKLLKPIEDNLVLYNCYNLLGVIAKDLAEYERALEYYNSALEYLQKIEGSTIRQLSLYNNIGVVHREMREFNQANTYFNIVLETDSLEQYNPKLFARALNNLAASKFQSGNISTVENELQRALSIRQKENDLEGISGSNYYLAEYYLSQKDTVRALFHALEAKKFTELSSNNERLLETLALITFIDKKNAALYSQQHFNLNDSLLLAERQSRNKFTRIQFETEEVEAQNQLLARQRLIWIGVAAGLFLLALSIFIIIIQRVKNQKLRFQQQQQEANNEIFSLMLAQNQKIEEGKKSEQRRISEELHDGILGEMNGARMILMGLNKKTDEGAITMRSTAIAKLQEVQEEIRSISHELSDAAYQKFHNFIISIQELLAAVGESASFKYNFTYEDEIDWDNLSAEIKINLYRIVQECLMNSVKHAQAENISVELDAEGELLLVRIKDDGKGFDPNKGKKGIGHKNISSRVNKINGNWSVHSKLGEGTTVTIEIPLVSSGPVIKNDLVALNN